MNNEQSCERCDDLQTLYYVDRSEPCPECSPLRTSLTTEQLRDRCVARINDPELVDAFNQGYDEGDRINGPMHHPDWMHHRDLEKLDRSLKNLQHPHAIVKALIELRDQLYDRDDDMEIVYKINSCLYGTNDMLITPDWLRENTAEDDEESCEAGGMSADEHAYQDGCDCSACIGRRQTEELVDGEYSDGAERMNKRELIVGSYEQWELDPEHERWGHPD